MIYFYKFSKYKKYILEKFSNAVPVSSLEEAIFVANTHQQKNIWYIDKDIWINDKFDPNYTVYDLEKAYIHCFVSNNNFGLYFVPHPKLHILLYNEKKEIMNKKISETDVFSKIIYDIIFLKFHETNANENLSKLKSRYPFVKVSDNVKGVLAAHKAASRKISTPYFYVVDADTEVLDTFRFDYNIPSYDFDIVHIWKSQNSINDLVYGNGGIKLIPKFLIDLDLPNEVDISTGLSQNIKIIDTIASINKFASSPWHAWRGGFREASKLASQVAKGHDIHDAGKRLQIWTTKGLARRYGSYVVQGAKAGKKFGLENYSNPNMLKKINDWNWLLELFKTQYKDLRIKY